MFNVDSIPGLITGFREGLEAFLIIVIMIGYFKKTKQFNYVKSVYIGSYFGIGFSLLFGGLLYVITKSLGNMGDNIDKLWESSISFVALILITTLIYYMIQNKGKIVEEITDKINHNLSTVGIIVLSTLLIAREGAEVTLFVFAAVNKGQYLIGALTGILLALIVVILISKSLIKVNLKLIFTITLVYLILQAGFLLGYSIHEFLSYLKDIQSLSGDAAIYTKLFDLSGTFLDHKVKPVGIILYALVGWYSKPEIIQFVIQYLYTSIMLYFFIKSRK